MSNRLLAVPLCALALCAVTLSGCGAARGPQDAAVVAATHFAAAVSQHDGAAACGLLGEAPRTELEKSAGKPCAQAITGEDLPGLGRIAKVETWGEQAQVRGSSDTVFLSHLTGHWLVMAAGCTPRPGDPYDCIVTGG
ncbi:MAG: hypothetical protein JWO79_3215 [Actinomycetia bacterium]|jgi:hypothetical protein|nr:hypothetical protein [Actinomycetes bacterium]MDQ1651699.1 hypothetical protein [Cryptosporangiaceae bacterium]